MSQWFSTQRATFRAMSEARSALIESNALDGAPFLMRLGHSRLFLILAFSRLEGDFMQGANFGVALNSTIG